MKLTIIGASGHGKVVADIASLCGYDEIEFLDDNASVNTCGTWNVTGNTSGTAKIDHDLFVAIGSARVRGELMEKYQDKRFVTLIHPAAVVAADVVLGAGSVVMAGAVINPGARLGKGCIVNTCSSIDHDCVLEDYCHVAVGAHLAGNVSVGRASWIGAGAVVSNRIKICPDCMIGAGAAVVRDLDRPGTYVGVPAKRLEK